jgi:hypothetical protein
MSEFDAQAEVQRLKAHTKAIRKREYSRRVSKLDKYKGELISMYRAGASGAELQRWLKEKRISCALSTVLRYVQKNG